MSQVGRPEKGDALTQGPRNGLAPAYYVLRNETPIRLRASGRTWVRFRGRGPGGGTWRDRSASSSAKAERLNTVSCASSWRAKASTSCGEANGTADFPDALQAHQPDVVVLDDGHRRDGRLDGPRGRSPGEGRVVWPAAVVPIGGDARVEPAAILRDLGPAVEHATAASAALTETFERPDWIDRVRKDPATLRNKPRPAGPPPNGRASPGCNGVASGSTRIGGRRTEPTWSTADGGSGAGRGPPEWAAGADAEPTLDLAVGTGAGEAASVVDEGSKWNRRLGTLALSGAAAVSALVLALALGGARVPVSVLRGGGILPPGVPGFVQGPIPSASTDRSSPALGGNHFDPEVSVRPATTPPMTRRWTIGRWLR